MANDEPKKPGLPRVPMSGELNEPKKTDLLTEITSFLRANWSKLLPFFTAISGETKTVQGSQKADEYACAFEVRNLANSLNNKTIGNLNIETIRRKVRPAFKRITGYSFTQIEQAGRERLRLAGPGTEPDPTLA